MTKKIFKDIRRLAPFARDLKKLKRFRTLEDDIKNFEKHQLNLFHKLNQGNGGIKQISGLGISYPKIYKVIKFACKALKGKGAKSGIRIIYAYYEREDVIEYIEIYFKADKANEDKSRIIKLYRK